MTNPTQNWNPDPPPPRQLPRQTPLPCHYPRKPYQQTTIWPTAIVNVALGNAQGKTHQQQNTSWPTAIVNVALGNAQGKPTNNNTQLANGHSQRSLGQRPRETHQQQNTIWPTAIVNVAVGNAQGKTHQQQTTIGQRPYTTQPWVWRTPPKDWL